MAQLREYLKRVTPRFHWGVLVEREQIFRYDKNGIGGEMWHVYGLFGNFRIYIGLTNNLKRRLSEDLNGHTHSTKRMGKLKLIFCESFISKIDAQRQEIFYKTGYGREVLKEKLKDTLKNI